MRILELAPVDTTGNGNPFLWMLVRHLTVAPGVTRVLSGVGWRDVPELEHDVVHVHWPEALTSWKAPTDRDLVGWTRFFESIDGRCRVVATVHNERPHPGQPAGLSRLYDIVYEHCDGLIHLGDVSQELFEFPRSGKHVAHRTIRHGNYASYPNSMDRREARRSLGLEDDASVIVLMGQFRSVAELDFALAAFRELDAKEKCLLIASDVPPLWSHLRHGVSSLIGRLQRGLVIHRGWVAPRDVQRFLNAADVVFVSRLDSLNSGLVPLGLSFGRVVVGPDHGVIGEELRRTDNPTFDPARSGDAARALGQGLALGQAGQGARNREYALEELAWPRLASEHVDFFGELSGT